MAKVKLDTMLDGVSCKLGNVVYSEWRGVKYARKYVKARDRKSTAQAEVRSTFLHTVSLWRFMPAAIKAAWDIQVSGKPFTGYNLFFRANFEAVQKGGMLEISRGTGITAPWNMSAAINSQGDITVNLEKGDDAAQVSFFVQKVGETDMKRLLDVRIDQWQTASPVVLAGFDPLAEYNVYAVATDAAMQDARSVSDSVGCRVTR